MYVQDKEWCAVSYYAHFKSERKVWLAWLGSFDFPHGMKGLTFRIDCLFMTMWNEREEIGKENMVEEMAGYKRNDGNLRIA